MADKISPERRSWNMSRIRGRDTRPEKRVRSILHKAGYRFRINQKQMPGKPDIVLKKYRTVVFVHGCYWHRHAGCRKTTTPKTNTDFWLAKFEETIRRDERKKQQLVNMGWHVVTVWECSLERGDEVLLKEMQSQLTGDHDG